MANSPAEKVEPDAGHLVESLRDFGYTLQSALADLIDNSLTAQAKAIEVIVHAGAQDSHLAVLDDGSGMDLPTLVKAMRMGGIGPLDRRFENDLGRFGLGLKTASLSQGRRVTVITRSDPGQKPLVRQWDIQYIHKSGWQLLADITPIAQQYLQRIDSQRSGTAVVIEELDRPTYLHAGDNRDEHLGRTLETIRGHLSMVFHRFIEDGVIIKLGATKLQPWDPFLKSISTQLPIERLYLRTNPIDVTPYVLPHHNKLTDEQHAVAAGPKGWNDHQGFYIYRCRRLIVPGTWLNLQFRKEEHFKLARIAVDLPNSMDADWHLNVMKSHVAAPAILRGEFKRIAADVRRQAAKVYRFRGELQAPPNPTPNRYVWRRGNVRGGVRYHVDRSHPVIRSLIHGGCNHEKLLDQVIDLIERTIPIASMLQEPAKTLDGGIDADPSADLDSLAAMVLHAEQFLVRAGCSLKDARAQVLSSEPFVRFRDALISKLNDAT
jgi:hypothetical protein